MFDRYEAGEQAVLVHVNFSDEGEREDLEELKMLVSSAGVNALGVVTTNRSAPSAKLFVGSGKAEEIASQVQMLGADVVRCWGCCCLRRGSRTLRIGQPGGTRGTPCWLRSQRPFSGQRRSCSGR